MTKKQNNWEEKFDKMFTGENAILFEMGLLSYKDMVKNIKIYLT
jgi:hypothetical protein